MILRTTKLAWGLGFLLCSSVASAVDSNDIPLDTPIASLVASAKSNLQQGSPSEALRYFDVAISRDPQNYLTIFQRGAAYLSLGKNAQASEDFNKVLSIKPDFEGALVQRAKLKSRNADWAGAKKDYSTVRKPEDQDMMDLVEAEGAAALAVTAEAEKDFEACVTNAGKAIMVASTSLYLRNLRARCRFERGEVREGVSDLQHVLQIAPGDVEPNLKMSAMLFYSLGDTEKGLGQIRQCLRSDQDHKGCRSLNKQEKRIDKALKKITQLREKKQYNTAAKLLVGDGEDAGLIEDVKEDIKNAKAEGLIHENAPNDLYNSLVEMACEFYNEMNNKKKATPYCELNLQLNPDSLHALLFKARRQLDAEEFEPAIKTLNHAKEHHPAAQQVGTMLQKAHTLLKRSKTKDYYKVLEVSNDADERTIKKAYRRMTKIHHPDKAHAQGFSKADSEKKMAAINEAYEVLSDPEKKAMFDRGEDPNSTEQQGHPFQQGGNPFGGHGGQQFFFQSGGQGFQHGGGGGGFPFGGQ